MAGTTTNFGITYPTSTDLVKDGATAIQTVATGFDTRLGDVTNYPNQIVNVVSGVSRPVAYASNTGQVTFTGSATISFAAGRFSQPPLVMAMLVSTANSATSVTTNTSTTSSITFYAWAGAVACAVNRTVNWHATQMTSASAAG